jgi:hypothetical protein
MAITTELELPNWQILLLQNYPAQLSLKGMEKQLKPTLGSLASLEVGYSCLPFQIEKNYIFA